MAKDRKRQVGPILGVLHKEDEHTHITRGKNVTIVGGSEESHAAAREFVVKVNEQLDRKGREVSANELRDIIFEASE